jgi:hypothetical protein
MPSWPRWTRRRRREETLRHTRARLETPRRARQKVEIRRILNQATEAELAQLDPLEAEAAQWGIALRTEVARLAAGMPAVCPDMQTYMTGRCGLSTAQ